MAEQQPKRGRGRPKLADRRMTTQLNVRVDADIRTGIEQYRAKYQDDYELRELSDAVRHMLKKVLKAESLLPPSKS